VRGPTLLPCLISPKPPAVICAPRPIRDAKRKVFLILDRLPVHRSAMVRDWLARHKTQIEIFYLPSYSPELNPDEGLNADLKQNATRKVPLRTRARSA
jgi:transposase